MSQQVFETVYRGRQGWLRHAAYMRMSKVHLALRTLRAVGRLGGIASVFDYGFGSGTLLRYLPKKWRIYGVEQDQVVVGEVAEMLREVGFLSVDLQAICISSWTESPLLKRKYDVVICSHVLEHLEDPVGFLRVVSACLEDSGVFVGLVPINERAQNPHHVQVVTRSLVESWARATSLSLVHYEENDPYLYWLQPLYVHDSGWRHRMAQVASLALGVLSKGIGESLWLGPIATAFSLVSRPTQAAFVLSRT